MILVRGSWICVSFFSEVNCQRVEVVREEFGIDSIALGS